MDFNQLNCSLESMRNRSESLNIREITYLRTYNTLVQLGARKEENRDQHFLQLATIVYGWMPRIVRINQNRLAAAKNAFVEAQGAKEFNDEVDVVTPVADCLHSVVGATKLLHFANPNVYPIWDSRVESVWNNCDPSQYQMSKPDNYLNYASEVHSLRKSSGFGNFFDRYIQIHNERLDKFFIQRYMGISQQTDAFTDKKVENHRLLSKNIVFLHDFRIPKKLAKFASKIGNEKAR